MRCRCGVLLRVGCLGCRVGGGLLAMGRWFWLRLRRSSIGWCFLLLVLLAAGSHPYSGPYVHSCPGPSGFGSVDIWWCLLVHRSLGMGALAYVQGIPYLYGYTIPGGVLRIRLRSLSFVPPHTPTSWYCNACCRQGCLAGQFWHTCFAFLSQYLRLSVSTGWNLIRDPTQFPCFAHFGSGIGICCRSGIFAAI